MRTRAPYHEPPLLSISTFRTYYCGAFHICTRRRVGYYAAAFCAGAKYNFSSGARRVRLQLSHPHSRFLSFSSFYLSHSPFFYLFLSLSLSPSLSHPKKSFLFYAHKSPDNGHAAYALPPHRHDAYSQQDYPQVARSPNRE